MLDRIIAPITNERRHGLSKSLAVALSVAVLSSLPPASSAEAAEKMKLVTEVHFDPGSVDVSPGGQQKIDKAIAALKQAPPREIHVIGFTDTTGDAAMNLAISRNRADSVASLLSKHGVNVPIVIEGKGEKGAPYKIDDDTSEPLNRCVGIIAVGQSGAKPVL